MNASSHGQNISVRVLKYDGTEYRRWSARIAKRDGSLIVVDAEFEIEVKHETLGTIPKNTRTIEYYWFDRWYNIFRFLRDEGRTRLYYCNINMPPEFQNGELTYVDLDIDILVQPDFSFQVLDVEEFEANAEKYRYSDEVRREAKKAVEEVSSRITSRQFPFHEVALSPYVPSLPGFSP